MTASPPARVTLPEAGLSSPPMIRSKVVLPEPFAPISAAAAPSPTRKLTSSSRVRPSGSA